MGFIFSAKAEHPLLNEDFFYYIENQEKTLSFLFIPMEESKDGTVIGIVGCMASDDEGDAMIASVYCAMEKENGVSDVYVGYIDEDDKFVLHIFLEIKNLRNLRASMKYVGKDKTLTVKRKKIKRTEEMAKEILQADIESNRGKEFSEMRKIAKLYKNGGRKEVRKNYGKAYTEQLVEQKKKSSSESR